MTAPQDPHTLLARALDQTGAVIANVRPEQATLPTPCRSWNVRTLVGHVVDEVHQFALVTAGGSRRRLHDDVLGDDWSGAFRGAADALLGAWRTVSANPASPSSGNDSPTTWVVGQHITELVMHAWDIAKATGQSTDLDPELGRLALRWGRDNLKPEFRGAEADGYQISPEVPLPDDAPLYDRLAAFGGRDPGGTFEAHRAVPGR